MGNSHPYIMNFLILAACVAVSASQQLVTYPNGAQVPALTPEVAAATAAHLGALPYAAGYPYAAGFPYAAGYGYAAPLVAHANGAVVPVDTVEVANAKAEFAAAGGVVNAAPYAAACAYAYGAYPYAHGAFPYAHGAYPYATPLVAHPNGAVVPVDPIAVVEARAAHLKAVAEA